MFGVINLEFAVCSFSCVPFILNSHCSHTPCFPCVAAFMKAICREHWEQMCHFSSVAISSTFVLVVVPIMGGGRFFTQAFPIFSLAFQLAELTKKWAELTWAELTKKNEPKSGPNWPKSGPNWPGLNWPESRPNWPQPNWPCGPNWPGPWAELELARID